MKKSMCLLLFSFFTLGASLKCYDCDPSSYGNCLDPIGSDQKITVCEPEVNKCETYFHDETDIKKCKAETMESECFTIRYATADSKQLDGIYRGCVSQPGNLSPCIYLKTLLDGQVLDCRTCSEDECNNESLTNSTPAL